MQSQYLRGSMAMLAGAALLYGSAAGAFGFNMGDRFNEGFDFDEGNDLDIGGSRMNWESPDNVWDTGTRSHKGFSWGGGPRSAPGWGFRDAPPPHWQPMPQPMPYGLQPMMVPTPYGWAPLAAPQLPIYTRPPAPPAPLETPQGAAQGAAPGAAQ
jgi:hypothetical protein